MSAGHAAGTRRPGELPSALSSWDAIIELLRDRFPAFFLDYDGTLTPIVSQPEDALLGEEMRDVLRQLARLCTVAVVSGRDRADVEPLVALDGLVFAGSHGFDIRGPDLRMEHDGGRGCLSDLEAAERDLRTLIERVPGARVERKRFAIANHYRNVSDADVPIVEEAVRDVQSRHPRLRLSGGKKIFELRPDIDWDKGRAVLWLLEALQLDDNGVLPVYIGDDVTDEDAFAALADRGLGIIVGTPPYTTHADYGLANCAEVQELLQRFVSLLKDERP